jgi:hypothetical protein
MPEIDLQKSTYIGDGAYAYFDGYGTWVFSHNGIQILDKVYLEPPVWKALVNFQKGVGQSD